METIALHTRIAPGREADYEREHAALDEQLESAMRRAGVHNWTIWRDGLDLFHLVTVDDYRAMRKRLAQDPVNIRWQEHINQLLEAVDDYSGDDSGLRRVWTLGQRSSG